MHAVKIPIRKFAMHTKLCVHQTRTQESVACADAVSLSGHNGFLVQALLIYYYTNIGIEVSQTYVPTYHSFIKFHFYWQTTTDF